MKITVYSTTTCPYCVMLKSWLQSKSVQFTNYMVDQNPTAAQNMVNLSGQMGVPLARLNMITEKSNTYLVSIGLSLKLL